MNDCESHCRGKAKAIEGVDKYANETFDKAIDKFSKLADDIDVTAYFRSSV